MKSLDTIVQEINFTIYFDMSIILNLSFASSVIRFRIPYSYIYLR